MDKMQGKNNSENNVQGEILELVKARLDAIPDSVHISIGSTEYSKQDILDNIEQNSEVGRDFIELQMDYLRDLASGALYAAQ